jgi:hypothetical protein
MGSLKNKYMGWIDSKKDLPTYYECVFAELTTGEIVEVWRASDGDDNIWTKFGTNQVFLDDDIVKWKRNKLEHKKKY